MQFTTRNSDQIRAGGVTLTFRNWKRPHAKVGGVYRLRPTGAVTVTRLANVRLAEVSANDAVRAGFPSVDAMIAFLRLPRTAEVTRVEFALTDDSPKAVPSLTVEEVVKRLEATDRRSAAPWTARVLALIEAHPAIRAGDLAPLTGWDTPSPHISPRAAMIAADPGPVRVLATESIAGPTPEGARARTGPGDPRGRGQRTLFLLNRSRTPVNT